MAKHSLTQTKLRERLYLAISLGIFLIAFFYFEERAGASATALAIFPVFVGSWFFGVWGGLFTSSLTLIMCIAILYFNSGTWSIFFEKGLIGTLSLFTIPILVGYLKHLEGQYKEKIDRSNQLIYALAHVASQMKISSDPDAVMKLMGKELDILGLKALVTLFIPGSQEMEIRYTSLDPDIVRKFERLARIKDRREFRISAEDLPADLNLAKNQHPLLLHNYEKAVSALLPGFSIEIIRRVVSSIKFAERALIGHFPLIYQEINLGFLWLWGENLQKEDLDALSIFAAQVASTLENARLFAELQDLALTDGLTKLYTRRHFFELAFEEFYRARRYGHPLSVLMLDLDHFKMINDTFGHLAGDTVLEKTAEICKTVLRAHDIIGRYGGEEFVILLVETDLNSARNVAERVNQLLANTPIQTDKGAIHLTISGGVSGDNVEELNLIEMIELADQALYVAKEAGRNNIQVAEPSILSD